MEAEYYEARKGQPHVPHSDHPDHPELESGAGPLSPAPAMSTAHWTTLAVSVGETRVYFPV